ncbi:MAG: RNA methyltransferase [Chitinispirillaceae bacterium]|nr:RNA methyltransferase [Chitinispirillaceae bacterium]
MAKPLSWYKSLSDARGRREEGFFLVEGRRAIEQIKTAAQKSIIELLVTDKLLDEFKKYPCPVRALTERQFKSVCTAKTPQGIAAVVRIPDNSYGGELPPQAGERILLLEGVQDPGNVGTLIRTAAAFDYRGVVLSDGCADPFSPKAVQASAGSIMSVWIRRTARYLDLAKELKNSGCRLVAADLRGEPLTPGYRLPIPHTLMLGSEASGLSNESLALADKKLRIPIDDAKAESLNVASSGAIMMFLSMAD